MNNEEVKATGLISTASSLERHTTRHLRGSPPYVGTQVSRTLSEERPLRKNGLVFLGYTYLKCILKIKSIFPSP